MASLLIIIKKNSLGVDIVSFQTVKNSRKKKILNPNPITQIETLLLNDFNLISISPKIGFLTNLKVLYLYNNQLTRLPESIGNLINLEILDLDENPLTSLPESISELTNLKIDLDENQLEIPMIKKKYDENLDLSDKHERIKKHSQNITSRLSPTSKTQLTRRRNIALSQGTNPLLDPLGYFNRYQDTMRSIELTENKLSKPDSGVVVAITAICLCHGKIKGDINTHINTASTRSNRDTLPTVSRPSVIIKIPQTNFDRVKIINMIIDNYKEYVSNNYDYTNPNEYLNFITNDLVVFIGYKVDLVKNDKNGAALWDELDKEINGKNLEVIKKALNELPLSFLLAFLGSSVYKLKVIEKR